MTIRSTCLEQDRRNAELKKPASESEVGKGFKILPYWENISAMGRSVFRNPDTIINLFLHFTERSLPKHISGDVLKDIVSGKLGLHENER